MNRIKIAKQIIKIAKSILAFDRPKSLSYKYIQPFFNYDLAGKAVSIYKIEDDENNHNELKELRNLITAESGGGYDSFIKNIMSSNFEDAANAWNRFSHCKKTIVFIDNVLSFINIDNNGHSIHYDL